MARKKTIEKNPDDGDWGNILGLFYLSIAALFFAALLSFDPGDLKFNQHPHHENTKNLVGIVGAWTGQCCFFVFGALAFLLPVVLLNLGLTYYFPKLCSLFGCRRVHLIALCMILSCAGMLDLISKSIPLLATSSVSPYGAGGFIGYALNSWFFVRFFHEIGAMTLYLTVYAASLVILTNLDVGALFRECWDWILDCSAKVIKNAGPEERRLRQQQRQLAREARRLQGGFRWPFLRTATAGADVEVLPKPKVVDHSVSASAPPRARARSAKPAPSVPEPAPQPEPPKKPSNSASPAPKATEPVITLPTAPNPAAKPKKKSLSVAKPPVIGDYILPDVDFLDYMEPDTVKTDTKETLMANAELMKNTLKQFGINVTLGDITKGPTITRYELHPAPGIKLERIGNLSNNIAAALKAERINMLVPVPGKGSVGIEIPNKIKSKVIIRDLLESEEWTDTKARLPIVLGKDVYGKPMIVDLAGMPHLLIAGSTGSGKSVCINAVIASLLYRYSPEDLRFVMIDPKVVELQQYNSLPHLVVPVVTDPKKVVLALRWVVNEMEKRYQIFAKVGVRNIQSFNDRVRKEVEEVDAPAEDPEEYSTDLDENMKVPREDEIDIPDKLSYIVVIIDELADLMLVAPSDVEMAIARITQMARAAGIHCIVATQRPSVDVITGVIKANIPARIAFQVASKTDSRTILDSMGADKLLGKGDMLYLPPGSAKLIRAQGVLITDEEIQSIVDHISQQATPSYEGEIHEQLNKPVVSASEGDSDEDEELIEKCIEVIRSEQKASVSLMQRRLRIGYTRAARIMDEIENRGIVGPGRGAEPREILIDLDGGGADGQGQGLAG